MANFTFGGLVYNLSPPRFSARSYQNNYRENTSISRTFTIDDGNATTTLAATENSPYVSNISINQNTATVALDLSNVEGNQTAVINLVAMNIAGMDTVTWTIHITEAGATWTATEYDYTFQESGNQTIELASFVSGTPTPTISAVGTLPTGVSLSGTTLTINTNVYIGGTIPLRTTNINGSDDANFNIDVVNKVFLTDSDGDRITDSDGDLLYIESE